MRRDTKVGGTPKECQVTGIKDPAHERKKRVAICAKGCCKQSKSKSSIHSDLCLQRCADLVILVRARLNSTAEEAGGTGTYPK